MFTDTDKLCIPPEVWSCVARYYENPVLLLRLAGVCRNSYKGATMDAAWEALIPYECEGNFHRAFIEAALATTENNRCIIRRCWTGSFPPRKCYPKFAFESRDYDAAFALAAQKDYKYQRFLPNCGYRDPPKPDGISPQYMSEEYPHLFDKCIRSRKFMITALKFSPWLYDKYYMSQDVTDDPEYCELAMRYSALAWLAASRLHLQACKDYDLKKRMLALFPYSFILVFSPSEPCSDPELILHFAPFYHRMQEYFIKHCHPEAFGLELCEQLCRIGFPIWIAKPDIEASFLRRFQHFKVLPPKFKNDREIFESVAKNDCEILRTATPEFRKDIALVLSIFEHNPGVLNYCDATIFADAEFCGGFKEALKKPNHFLFRTEKPSKNHRGREPFPHVLQTRELALVAVECYGQWIHYFPRLQNDFEVVKAAVVTWPLAYGYTPHETSIGSDWSESICRIDPRAVWVAGERFIRKNRTIVCKALQLGPLPNNYDHFPFVQDHFYLLAEEIECVLPEILRAHPSNFEMLCARERNRRFILGKKRLIIAALEGTRNSSILWDVSPKILDEDIRNKAREVR